MALFLAAARAGDIDAVFAYLLNPANDLNAQGEGGVTALMAACSGRQAFVVEALLGAGVGAASHVDAAATGGGEAVRCRSLQLSTHTHTHLCRAAHTPTLSVYTHTHRTLL